MLVLVILGIFTQVQVILLNIITQVLVILGIFTQVQVILITIIIQVIFIIIIIQVQVII